MKLIRIESEGTGIALGEGERAVAVAAALPSFRAADAEAAATIAELLPDPEGSWRELIASWERGGPAFERLATWAEQNQDPAGVRRLTELSLLAPLAGGDVQVFAVGANFSAHANLAQNQIYDEEQSIDERSRQMLEGKAAGVPPWGFTILPRTIAAPGEEIRPPASVAKLDYEGEVAAILRGSAGPDPGSDGIELWGYTAWNDLSIRDPHFGIGEKVDAGPMTWSLQKNFQTGSSCGPWVVIGEGRDLGRLGIRTTVNEEERQRGTTAEMVYSFADCIAHFAHYLRLESGDMIVSGTPAGTAMEQGVDGPYLNPGDEVVVEVDGVAPLVNRVGGG